MIDGRIGEDRIECGAQRRDGLWSRAMPRGPQVALGNDVIVGVIGALARLPLVGFAHRIDRVGEALLAGDVREMRHTHPECALLPAPRVGGFLGELRHTVRRAHALELPVGDARSELEHVLVFGVVGSRGDGRSHDQR